MVLKHTKWDTDIYKSILTANAKAILSEVVRRERGLSNCFSHKKLDHITLKQQLNFERVIHPFLTVLPLH